jgi:pyruvate,orthophosphate dikinase
MSTKRVYAFEEGDGKNKKLLGGKGANLCEMTQIGLRVPPGFVITTEACLDYLDSPDKELPSGLMDEVRTHLRQVEQATGRTFGDPQNPLLVSVRSGSALSMPGMMETVLNLGLNTETLEGLIKQTSNERFGWDAYRRFIQLYASVVNNISGELFSNQLEAMKQRFDAKTDTELTAEQLKELTGLFLEIYEQEAGHAFPQEPYEQLEESIKAVFDSWMGHKAIVYRRENKITKEMANGTAANVVAMVFGNMGNDSGTGVGFTRDPGTGENVMYGEYLFNAQGEDVVAGIRTPKPILEMATEMPELHAQLEDLRNKLEKHYREVQDFEFTIEKGTLYCLQTRNGKMNATAMVRTSVEMVKEGILTKEEALQRINPEMLTQLLHRRIDPDYDAPPAAKGLNASPGAAFGKCIFDADSAEEHGNAGERVILVREETKPEDIHGFFAAQGVLTSRGGKTSHAAVVARGMGKPCVAGAEGIHIDTKRRLARIGDQIVSEGEIITIDGTNGNVYLGEVPTIPPEWTEAMETLLGWADDVARLGVLANADTPIDANRARTYGAKGIGLCRTERMFNDSDRLPHVVNMIVSETTEERLKHLEKLLEMQRDDFIGILKAMSPYPVTIRLLDPPIHEFLPLESEAVDQLKHLEELAVRIDNDRSTFDSLKAVYGEVPAHLVKSLPLKDADLEKTRAEIEKKKAVLHRARVLHEINPMLGHRGVRLSITYPEIYEMQIRAILEAAAECEKDGIEVHPEIMVPQVIDKTELEWVKKLVDKVYDDVRKTYPKDIRFLYGTMMETVRACVTADKLAEVADFFSFGTNDLTQATYSFSREDAENKFIPDYQEHGILPENPFEALDNAGVAELLRMGVEKGRQAKPDLKVGICGEHGGHPASIHICHDANLTYVSCSAPRVPTARLAAAHANLAKKQFDY